MLPNGDRLMKNRLPQKKIKSLRKKKPKLHQIRLIIQIKKKERKKNLKRQQIKNLIIKKRPLKKLLPTTNPEKKWNQRF